MFGTYRFILALLVVNGHLFLPWYPAGFAVYSFFILSGYLMTLIMNERYGYTPRGFMLYAANRFLRIYPPYFAGIGISLLLLTFVSSSTIASIQENIRLPVSSAEWIKNLAIFGLDRKEPSRLVPQAWALHIELFYYVAIGLLLGRSRLVALVWLVAGGLWYFWIYFTGRSAFFFWYGFIPSASLPFSMGCCLYHFRVELGRLLTRVGWGRALGGSTVLFAVPLVLPLLPLEISLFRHESLPFFLNLISSALVTLVLMQTPRDFLPRFRGADRFLGDLSYPLYLFHWSAGVLAAHLFGFTVPSVGLLLAGGAIGIALSALEALTLSRNLERLRSRVKDRLRRRASESAAAPPTACAKR